MKDGSKVWANPTPGLLWSDLLADGGLFLSMADQNEDYREEIILVRQTRYWTNQENTYCTIDLEDVAAIVVDGIEYTL